MRNYGKGTGECGGDNPYQKYMPSIQCSLCDNKFPFHKVHFTSQNLSTPRPHTQLHIIGSDDFNSFKSTPDSRKGSWYVLKLREPSGGHDTEWPLAVPPLGFMTPSVPDCCTIKPALYRCIQWSLKRIAFIRANP